MSVDQFSTAMHKLLAGIKITALWLLITLLAILLFTSLAPVEQILGSGARIVYLHGAWVWAGLVTIAAAGLTGVLGGSAFVGLPAGSCAFPGCRKKEKGGWKGRTIRDKQVWNEVIVWE